MLPEPSDGPSQRPEASRRAPIARLVPQELRPPVPRVEARNGPMSRARVPEASVDEDRQSEPRKQDVGPRVAAASEADAHIFAEAEADPMQGRADGHLWSGVAARVSSHHGAGRGRHGVRIASEGHAAGRGGDEIVLDRLGRAPCPTVGSVTLFAPEVRVLPFRSTKSAERRLRSADVTSSSRCGSRRIFRSRGRPSVDSRVSSRRSIPGASSHPATSTGWSRR
jgi:hypothetical protein